MIKIDQKLRVQPNTGSFRDPANRVYELAESGSSNRRVLRGLNEDALNTYKKLANETFFRSALADKKVVDTKLLNANDVEAATIMEDGWAGVLEHEPIGFVSYPYEWSFSMLKDAALLQLELTEQCLENGWVLKDATPYNIQWRSARPVFIDVGSFEIAKKGEPWVGYRQFCSMYLYPLMMRAHLKIDHLPLLRSYLDGISAAEAARFFSGAKQLKKGVLSHIKFPAAVENSISKRERDAAPAKERNSPNQSKAMILGLVQSLQRLVRKLTVKIDHTDWSHYEKTHSYRDKEFQTKKDFILKHASKKRLSQIWDLGCNTGSFSRLVQDHCDHVIALDGDHNAIEQLYLIEKEKSSTNILPMVMDLGNISPNQGWAGRERTAFDQRGKPQLVMCLALIHHMRMTASIPNALFLSWLRTLNSDVILEFVNRHDEMVVKLLTNKAEKYEDYNVEKFRTEADLLFEISDHQILKGGKRELFFLTPRDI